MACLAGFLHIGKSAHLHGVAHQGAAGACCGGLALQQGLGFSGVLGRHGCRRGSHYSRRRGGSRLGCGGDDHFLLSRRGRGHAGRSDRSFGRGRTGC